MIEPRIKIPKITNEARQRIRNNSVAKLPANASESGLSAIALQELFVAPIIGEQNSIITEYNAAIGEVNIVLNAFDGVVSKSSEDSAKAITDSCAALVAASNAEESALKSAKDSAAAGLAAKQAEDNSIAADTNSKAALENSITAKQNAKTALDTANGIDAKATTALGNSTAALDKSVTAENTANTVRSEFDQIVEGKIGISQDILSTDPLTAPSSEAVRNALDDLTQVITPTNQQSQVVHLEGTSAGFVDELIMSSEPTQVVSPNLFDFYNSPITEESASHTILNEIISVTIESERNGRIWWRIPNKLVKGKQITASIKVKSFEAPGFAESDIGLFIREMGHATILTSVGIKLGIISTTFIYNGDLDLMFLIYRGLMRDYESKVTFSQPVLNLGSTVLPYQPYTGQPSPDNPIPINVVSSPIEIMSAGNNLLDINSGSILKPNTVEIRNNEFILNGNDISSFVEYDVNFPTNGTYSLDIIANGEITGYDFLSFNLEDKNLKNYLGYQKISYGKYVNDKYNITYTNEKKQATFIIDNINAPFKFTLWSGGYNGGNTYKNFVLSMLQVNKGETVMPYSPYNAVTTQIPLETVATETTPSTTVELLGEYNTKTNVLGQKYEKVVFDGSPDEAWAEYISPGQDNLRLTTYSIANKVKDTGASIVANILSNQYIPKAVIDTYNNIQGIAIGGTVLHIKDYRYSQLGSLTAFKNWLSTNPLTVYYELATPEILTLNPAPPITTLEGTTNIYTVNNASPVTFNITELLDGGNQTNVVLKDKDDNVLNPRTVAQQVRINDDGETLDRELERIQAAISGVDSDLSAEISARTAADTQIRGDIAKVDSDLQSEKLARAAANTYDVVIRTQEQFDELYNSATWLDAKSVAFIGDGGVLKFTRTGQGLKIPSTVTTIVGYNWATIRINKFEYDEVNNLAALYYESFNYMSSIQDIKVECDSYFHNKKNSVCFYRCSNMRRCIGYCETSGGLQGITVSFLDCDNLNGCIGTIESDVTEKTKGAFVNCSCLYDCKGGTTYGAIFDNCKNIANCRDIRTRATFGIVFLNCQQISNCIVKGTDTGFNKCSNLTNCTADAGDHRVDAFGFLSCANLTNCKASGVASRGVGGRGYGFYNVSYCSCCGASDIVSTSAIAGGTNTKIDSNTCDFTNS